MLLHNINILVKQSPDITGFRMNRLCQNIDRNHNIFDVRGRELTMQAGIDAAQLKLMDISLAYQKHNYARGHHIPLFVAQEQQQP